MMKLVWKNNIVLLYRQSHFVHYSRGSIAVLPLRVVKLRYLAVFEGVKLCYLAILGGCKVVQLCYIAVFEC